MESKINWWFNLLKSLCAEMNSSEELLIFEESGQFILTANKEFENITSADEV